ncbi:hypothetical protein ACO0R3_001757 [Hanseniaspora guilliermondii]
MTSNIKDYKHVSFINVLPDLEDYEYQRILNNNRFISDDNEVLHHPLYIERLKSNISSNFIHDQDDIISKHLSEHINEPLLYNKIIEEQERLANENTRINSHQYSNNSLPTNKFSNLREIEDVKMVSNDVFDEDCSNSKRKNTSKIGNLSKGKNISDMTLDEITLIEDELRKSRQLKKKSNSADYNFNMSNESYKPLSSDSMENYMLHHDHKSNKSILNQKEKLFLQNGYPSRPWVKNNSCILNYQTKMKASQKKRTIFVYVSGREHTWTSLEYYFKYLQNDYDHLVIGTWIEKTGIIEPEFEKSQYTHLIHLKKSLKDLKIIENDILQSCHDFLNYAIYKNKDNKPVSITCHLQADDDVQEVLVDFINEYQPNLNIITSVTFNHFIKFQNETVKMSNFLSKISSSCLIINQDYLAVPLHQHSSYLKPSSNNATRRQHSLDIINSLLEETSVFPYENCTSKDMSDLHKYIPSERNFAFKKYHYTFPMVPKKINAQMSVSTEEGFFIRFGYKRPVIEPLQFKDYDESLEDVTVSNFYHYTNSRRVNERMINNYKTAIDRFKPSLFYLDKTNDKSTLARMLSNEYSQKSSAQSGNSAAMMMLKKVVSSSSIDTLQRRNNSDGNSSRRNSSTSLDLDNQSFLTSKGIKTSEEVKRKREEEHHRKEKLKQEMEREMISTNNRKLVSQNQDALKRFQQEKKLLERNKQKSQDNIPKKKSSNDDKDKERKTRSWKFW